MVTGQLLPNAAQHFWIYGLAVADYAGILRRSEADPGVIAQLEQLEALARTLVRTVGEPYHDPAAEQAQAAWQRAQASTRRFAGH